MGNPPADITEQSHAHDLQLILRSTHSFLAHHSPYIRNGKSLRILDIALLTAIADLQELGAASNGTSTAHEHLKGHSLHRPGRVPSPASRATCPVKPTLA
jgi:hypothetical protein